MAGMTISARGVAMIKRFEGFCSEGLELADGLWLVGHGHQRMSAPEAMSEDEAHGELMLDLVAYEGAVRESVSTPLSQSQFDALVSFAFSVGLAAFARSDVVRRVNSGDFIAAGAAMEAWRKSAVHGNAAVLDALVIRRAAERAMLMDTLCPQPAPSLVVRPIIDHAAAILGAPSIVSAMPSLEDAVLAFAGASPALANADPHTAPQPDPVAARIATILAAEPATATALLAAREAQEDADLADGEPPLEAEGMDMADARAVPGDSLLALQAVTVGSTAAPGVRRFNADWIALCALVAFGLGLLTIAGLALAQSGGAGDGWLAASVLGAPGALAVGMGAYHFAKGPSAPRA